MTQHIQVWISVIEKLNNVNTNQDLNQACPPLWDQMCFPYSSNNRKE